jgi:hypothetical protein
MVRSASDRLWPEDLGPEHHRAIECPKDANVSDSIPKPNYEWHTSVNGIRPYLSRMGRCKLFHSGKIGWSQRENFT